MGMYKHVIAGVSALESNLTSAIQTLSAQVTAGASVNAQSAMPPVVKSPSVQYPRRNNYLFVRGFPRKMIGRDLVKELEDMCQAAAAAYAQQGNTVILAQPTRSGCLVSRQGMV